ncbi:MAG: hypothetical protein L0Z53_19135, partial [Acidobacteriales bacterium]|nr:hypothetical protein [Terriglobales bacterium]
MAEIAVAQLGSDGIDEPLFCKLVAEATIRRIVPIALRAAAALHPQQEHKANLTAAADACETEGTADSAYAASKVCGDALRSVFNGRFNAAADEMAKHQLWAAYFASESARVSAESAAEAAQHGLLSCAGHAADMAASIAARAAGATGSKEATYNTLKIAADIGVAAL